MCGQAHGVARVFKNPLLNAWILHNRRSGGLHIHPRRGGIRPLAAALKQGHVGLQVTDQHQRLRGVMAPFFGRLASCERAAASLALRGGHPIVFGAAIRVGYGFRFRMIAAKTLQPAVTGDREQDLRVLVTAMNQGLETMIRAAPEQYLWIHDRYRDRPSSGSSAAAADEDLACEDDPDEGC
jgi:KDO2-lipid IV(A) lauroyltransferase